MNTSTLHSPAAAIARWPVRAALALGLVALAGVAVDRFGAPPMGLHFGTPRAAPGHLAAASAQQGAPTSAAELRASIEHDLPIVRARAAASSAATTNAWADRAALGDLLLARARLTGAFEDYVGAGAAFETAFAIATPGTGPHLERAGYNLAIHRLGAVEPDLVAVEHHAVPDAGELAAVAELRGDVAFYRGHYAPAKAFYDRSRATLPTIAADVKLANWHARLGDPARALALLDEADARAKGPAQQLRAFIALRRGVIELARGRWAEAEAQVRHADDVFPGWAPIELQLATIRALRGAPDEALAILRRTDARDALPDSADALAGLARARGDFAGTQAWAAKAGARWDTRLALLPEAALGHAIDHELAFGDPRRALVLAGRNYLLRPYGDAATALAAAFLANQRPEAALRVLAPQFAAGWSAAEAHVIASEAHALLGHAPQAEAERAAALAINPHSLDRNPGMIWLEQ